MEELTENAEEPDDGDSKKEEQKLGKLQYKVGSFIVERQMENEGGTAHALLRYDYDYIIVFSFNIKFLF